MLASRVLITAGTPDSMYLEDRQEKWLWRKRNEGGHREEGKQGLREVGRFQRRKIEGLKAVRG